MDLYVCMHVSVLFRLSTSILDFINLSNVMLTRVITWPPHFCKDTESNFKYKKYLLNKWLREKKTLGWDLNGHLYLAAEPVHYKMPLYTCTLMNANPILSGLVSWFMKIIDMSV